MKITLFILLVSSSVFGGFGLPAGWGDAATRAGDESCAARGVVLETDVQSSHRCRLTVVSAVGTVVDRGVLPALTRTQELVGSFRFWQEPTGRVLYVYDDTQSLLCRVSNPTCVTVHDVLD